MVNDGGGDGAQDVISDFSEGPGTRLLDRPNGGPAAARNTGLAAAQGQYVVFVDDDCVVAADALGVLDEIFRARRDVLVGAKQCNALVRNPFATLSQMVLDVVYEVFNPDPQHAAFVASCFMAAPVGLLRDAGGFDEGFRTSEDRELCDRWLAMGRDVVYAHTIKIEHYHDLTMAGLWRQHFAYGQGAHKYHRRRKSLGRGGLRVDNGFYRALMSAPVGGGYQTSSPVLYFLLLYQQFANAAGYFYERLRGGCS